MMAMFDDQWEQRRRVDYAKELARGEHDRRCEQRERSYICNCAYRKRIKSGFTDPPMLVNQYPYCDHCGKEVDHDGDHFFCPRCNVVWPQGVDTIGKFNDDFGTGFGGEQFGSRLIEVI